MGSGPGNKPSHGGNGYKIGSTVATVLSRLGLEARRDQESCAYARAEQEQSDFEKAEGARGRTEPRWRETKRKEEGDTTRHSSAQNQSRDNEELDTAKVVDVDVKHVGRMSATVFLRKKKKKKNRQRGDPGATVFALANRFPDGRTGFVVAGRH
ncbi:hypothetical protein ALC62_08821 [Cyphomyrmex costatus]|uniref:Uncharacterized protein n=1 Tax=Cyphomyrmex costatus TaxID=456900 RepID=A0A195CHW5_9HYME|nr:hypothetical protein ALC62_08821 [Cyphomyrmex costatus]